MRDGLLPWPYVRAWRCPVFLGLGFCPSDHIWASLGLFRGVCWGEAIIKWPPPPVSGLRAAQNSPQGWLRPVAAVVDIISLLPLVSSGLPLAAAGVTSPRRSFFTRSCSPFGQNRGPAPCSNPWAGPPLTALWSNYVAGRPSWLLRRPSTKPMFGLDNAAATVAWNHATGLLHIFWPQLLSLVMLWNWNLGAKVSSQLEELNSPKYSWSSYILTLIWDGDFVCILWKQSCF